MIYCIEDTVMIYCIEDTPMICCIEEIILSAPSLFQEI